MKPDKILLLIFLSMIGCSISAQDLVKATNGSVITVQSGGIVYVNGGISLDDGSSISNGGIITLAKTGSGTADFTDNTSNAYNYGTGKFVFSGTGTQIVKSINQFERIDVSNVGLNLSSNIKANTWYLISGAVNTGSFTAIATSAANTAMQADVSNMNFANSWINGNLQRSVTPATVSMYQFPLGNATNANIAEIDNPNTNYLTGISSITASFGPKPGNDNGLNVSESATAYLMVNGGGVWYLTPDASPASGAYDLKLYINNFSGLADNSFGILGRPDASSNATDWIVPVGSSLLPSGSPGRTVASGYALRNDIPSFGQFGIGMSVTPLPLDLLSFTAMKKDKTVLLHWETANEVNTDHFDIYRAGQSGLMQHLGQVAAAGTSSISSDYDYTDNSPLSGLNYYQLKMVDRDNKFKLSQIVKVDFEDAASFSIFPNPVTGNEFFVQYDGTKVNWVKLFASDGRLVKCDFAGLKANQIAVKLQSAMAKGAYTVQVSTDKGIKIAMIMVK